jgi:hypothetical protein
MRVDVGLGGAYCYIREEKGIPHTRYSGTSDRLAHRFRNPSDCIVGMVGLDILWRFGVLLRIDNRSARRILPTRPAACWPEYHRIRTRVRLAGGGPVLDEWLLVPV